MSRYLQITALDILAYDPLGILTIEAGWNDASSGPLLPSLQARYEIRYLVSEFDKLLFLYAPRLSLTRHPVSSEYHLPGTMLRVHRGGVVKRMVDGQVRIGMGESKAIGTCIHLCDPD